MRQGYYLSSALVKENLSYFSFTLPKKTCQGKTSTSFPGLSPPRRGWSGKEGKLASVNSRQVFLDKWTCQGKIARVNEA